MAPHRKPAVPGDETRCLTVLEMLTEAGSYWRAARETGDLAGEALWLDAINVLLDRKNAAQGS
jgi:hypothetical protein